MNKFEEHTNEDENADFSESLTKSRKIWLAMKKILQHKFTKLFLFLGSNALIISLIVFLFLEYDLFNQVSNIKISTLVIYCSIFVGLMILKSYRYTLLQVEKLNLGKSFLGVSLGFLINSLLPGRLGDVSRFVYLKKSSPELSSGEIIGSLVIEKVIDLISLCLFALVLVLFFAIQVVSNVMWIFLIVGLLMILIAVIIFLIIKYHKFFDKILTAFIAKFSDKIDVEVKLSETINVYFRTLIKSKKKVIVNIALSLVIVFIDTFLIYLILHELLPLLPVHLGILTGAIGFLAVVFPILPGGLGTYQGSMVLTLSVFSFSEALTFAASTSEFAIRTSIYILIGLPVYLLIFLQNRRKKEEAPIVTET